MAQGQPFLSSRAVRILENAVGAPPGAQFAEFVSPVVNISQAQVQAMGTTEVDLVAAVPGSVLWPRLLIVEKAAGAYTVVGVTMELLGWGTVAQNAPAFPFDNAPAFGMLTNAGVDTRVTGQLFSNGTAGGLPFGVLFPLPTPAGVSGLKLALRTTGASPAGAGGALKAKIWYDVVPDSFFDLV